MPNNQNINFKYNSDGIRTYKYFIDNDEMYLYQHDYMLDGSTIVGEKVTYNSYYAGARTKYKYYYYDENGLPIGMGYEGKDYYFQKNILGDIEAIYQGSTKVVQYTYDAWGNILSVTGSLASTIGQENPFRYRGYYYDTETGLYYLQSRYYDPQVGRFINADDALFIDATGTLLGCNLYSYCENNFVNCLDIDGNFTIKIYAIAAVTAAVISAVAKIVGNYANGLRGWNIFRGVLGSAIGSAVNVVLLMKLIKWGTKGMLLAAFSAAAVQSVFDFAEGVLIDKKYRWKQLTKDFVMNFASTFVGNYIGAKSIFINGTWYQPQFIGSFFTKSYGKKLIAQTGIGAVISLLIDLIKSGLSKL